MLDIKKIESVAVAIMDVLYSKNFTGTTLREAQDDYLKASDLEKIDGALNFLGILSNHLEREFKIYTLTQILEDVLATKESKQIAKDILAGKDGAFKRASDLVVANQELIGKTMKEKAVGKKAVAVSKMIKIDKTPVERID